MSNPDVCIYCAASGCVSNTAEHGTECPFTTGLWPVDDDDLQRGMVCAACDEPFVAGDLSAQVTDMTHPAVGGALDWLDRLGTEPDDVTFTVCIPCAAMGREVAP